MMWVRVRAGVRVRVRAGVRVRVRVGVRVGVRVMVGFRVRVRVRVRGRGLLPTTSHCIFYSRVGQIAIFSHCQP